MARPITASRSTSPRVLKPRRGHPFHPLLLDVCRHLPQPDLSPCQHRSLGAVCCYCLDGGPHSFQMTPIGLEPTYLRTLLRQGINQFSVSNNLLVSEGGEVKS